MDLLELKAQWKEEQAELKQRLILTDNIGWVLPPCNSAAPEAKGSSSTDVLHLVGGLDMSFFPSTQTAETEVGHSAGKPTRGVAALVVLSYPDFKVVYEDYEVLDLTVPYLPGFLAFREVPAYVRLLERAKSTSLMPEVALVDGCGTLHPEGFGAACHLGVITGVPTIGVAKNLLCIEGLDRKGVHRALQELASHAPGPETPRDSGTSPSCGIDRGPLGQCVPLVGTSGRTLAVALRPGSAINPIYVSVGHRVGLTTALELVWSCCKFRVPEPTRAANIRSREYIRTHGGKSPMPPAVKY